MTCAPRPVGAPGRYVADDAAALVLTGPTEVHIRRSGFQKHWRAVMVHAQVTGLHFHDLRHTGNTLTAHAGANLSDLMTRTGHSSTRAARIYLHTTPERDRAVATTLNALLTGAAPRRGSGT